MDQMTFVSPEGDVYNYGILLLEMQTRKGPTDIMFGDGLSLCELGKKGISDKITAQLLMPQPENKHGVQKTTKGNVWRPLLGLEQHAQYNFPINEWAYIPEFIEGCVSLKCEDHMMMIKLYYYSSS